MKKLRIAIVGFGFMGKTHALNILKNPSLQLVAIVDKNVVDLEKAVTESTGNFSTGFIKKEEISEIKSYRSVDECMAGEQLDAAFVCIHTLLHYEITKKILDKGIHVFVEKPFVLDISQGEELIQIAQKNKRLLMVGHVVRFMPAYQTLKSFIDNTTYGELEFISLTRFTGIPNWGEWKSRQNEFGSSGGALFDLVIHDIDFLHYVLGFPDITNTKHIKGALSNNDYICTTWSYNNKPYFVKIEGGNTFHSAFPFDAGFKAQFSEATAIWSSSNELELKIADNNEIKSIVLDEANKGFNNEINYFFECILYNKTPTECEAKSALKTIQLCYKLIQ